MNIRKARPSDAAPVLALAASLGLDYPELTKDALWVAEEGGRVVGHIALRRHADCSELTALGVDPKSRRQGLGRALVETLFENSSGDIHLATVIPGFFSGCGFVKTDLVPGGMVKEPSWCEGCRPEECSVMVRRRG